MEQIFTECQAPQYVLNTPLGALPWWHLESSSVISQDWDMHLFQPTLLVICGESHCPSQNKEVKPDSFKVTFQLLNLKI